MHSLFDRALAAARQLGASDVHLKPGLAPILRINGELRTLRGTLRDVPPLSREFIHSLVFSMLNDRRREILERTGDVALSLTTGDGARQRVLAWQHRGGVAVAVRLVPPEVPSMATLEIPAEVAGVVGPGRGLFLVAGGAGSGRTTTLASLIDHVGSERACHVVTVEDPVEFLLRDRRSVVTQREVGLDAPSAAAALRAAARQDADVVAAGDLRDGESAALLLAAAESGRLVLAGIGARDAVDAIARFIALFPPGDQAAVRTRVAAVLLGAQGQRLCARADGQGRVLAADLLIVDAEARDLIARGGTDAELRARMAAGLPPGSTTFDTSLVQLARRNRVNPAEARLRADDGRGVTHAMNQGAVGAEAERASAAGSTTPEVEDNARAD